MRCRSGSSIHVRISMRPSPSPADHASERLLGAGKRGVQREQRRDRDVVERAFGVSRLLCDSAGGRFAARRRRRRVRARRAGTRRGRRRAGRRRSAGAGAGRRTGSADRLRSSASMRRRQHLLGEHRRLVDDDRLAPRVPGLALARCSTRRCPSPSARTGAQELREVLGRLLRTGRRAAPRPCRSAPGAGSHRRPRRVGTQRLEHRGLAGPGRADERRDAAAHDDLEGLRLLGARAQLGRRLGRRRLGARRRSALPNSTSRPAAGLRA